MLFEAKSGANHGAGWVGAETFIFCCAGGLSRASKGSKMLRRFDVILVHM